MHNYREIYHKYLNTPVKQWDNIIALPTKKKVAEAIFSFGDKFNHNIGSLIEEYLLSNKNIWLWSDLHFNHKNICQHANRPFLGLSDMHSAMIKGYYSTVKKDDLVIFGGDIAFGEFSYIDSLISSLPGTKALIIGNHDLHFKTLEPINYKCFDYINSFANFNYLMDNNITQEIVLTHYPLDIKSLPDKAINIHGHTHQHLMGDRRLNMSVEHTSYKPKSLHSFLKND